MKKYISIIVLLSLFVIGCSEQANINSPVNNVNTNEPNWIALPQAEGMQLNQEWKTSKRINGAQGGYLTNNVSYRGGISGTVTISAKLAFNQGAFAGNETITMTLSDQNTSAQFEPSRTGFARTVLYNVTYTGLNLSGLNPADIKFAYIAADGSTEYAQHDGITVNIATGTICVKNANLPHFSRYGFVNKTY
jgi:hypothetical protein